MRLLVQVQSQGQLSCQKACLGKKVLAHKGGLHSGLSSIFYLNTPNQYIPFDLRNICILNWLCHAFSCWRTVIKSWGWWVMQTQHSLSRGTNCQEVCGRIRGVTYPTISGKLQHQLEKQTDRSEEGHGVWLISWGAVTSHWPSVCLVLASFLHSISRRDQFLSESLCLPSHYLLSRLLQCLFLLSWQC